MQPKSTYASYLLRLWQVQNDGQAVWIASIQSPATGEQRRFASVSALLAFLQAEFGDSPAPDCDDAAARHSADR